MEGFSEQPISVQWAEMCPQTKKKLVDEGSTAENRMLFFAKVLRSATEDEVKELFTRFGTVYDVNLFRAFQGAPTTKGCGLLTMSSHKEAEASIEALDGQFVWEGMESPMVVKWMDGALQRRRREQHLAAMRQGLVSNTSIDSWMAPSFAPLGGMPLQSRAALGPSGLFMGGGLMHHGGLGGPGRTEMLVEVPEMPPAGCSPDAIKLFVGNIPKSCTEEQLMSFFETIGKVIELIILRDKITQESKGSAFVWYVTRSMAEQAILQLNLSQALTDGSGKQDRPLAVRKAKARIKAHSIASVINQPHPTVGMLTGSSGAAGPSMIEYDPRLRDPRYLEMDPRYIEYQFQQQQHQQQLAFQPNSYLNPRMMTANQPQGIYDTYGQGGINAEQLERYMATSHNPSGLGVGGVGNVDPSGQIAMSIAINQQQLFAINAHLYKMQCMSGAQLNITPGNQDLFHLVVSGSEAQVEAAKSLVSSVIGTASL